MEISKKSIIKNLSLIFFIYAITQQFSFASGTMDESEIDKVNKVDAASEEEKNRLSIAAGLLSDYEILAKKLVASLNTDSINVDTVNQQANKLLELSETVIDSAQFRLPQCKEYLKKSLQLKDILHEISNEELEKDYHHDGALPKASAECYHTKDLFVHPATVVVLTRDDPQLNNKTKSSINAEITEVLSHLELVRQLIIY